jgi:hypothetical protein
VEKEFTSNQVDKAEIYLFSPQMAFLSPSGIVPAASAKHLGTSPLLGVPRREAI